VVEIKISKMLTVTGDLDMWHEILHDLSMARSRHVLETESEKLLQFLTKELCD
jgi:hypothetical protein